MDSINNIKIIAPRKIKRKYAKIPHRKSAPRKTENVIVLENDLTKVVIDYKNGGKIRSFVSKETGTEFFYQDKRQFFNPEKGYSYHDTSGFDECFPTIAPCCYKVNNKEVSLDDHGSLWQKPWQADVKGDKVNMFVDLPELSCKFERRCKLEKSSLKIDYSITNYGEYSLPFLYSAHPLLCIEKKSQLELPKEVKEVYVSAASENLDFLAGGWVDIDILNKGFFGSDFSVDKQSFIKFFTNKLIFNQVSVRHTDTNESLNIRFDSSQLPYLGVFVGQGYDSLNDGNFRNEMMLGLEPTTGIGDDLPICEATNSLKQLEYGKRFSFWIRMTHQGCKI